jgi:uncharacterized protein involved in exopolysaccharide biosynthesis
MDTETRMSMSVRDILHVVFKRKTHILLFFGITVGTVAIGSFNKTPTYEAYAQILVKIGREDVYAPALSTGNPSITVDRDKKIYTEIEILKSRILAEKLVKTLGPTVIYGDLNVSDQDGRQSFRFIRSIAERLQGDLSIKEVENSDVITVRFLHKDPQMAAKVINTLVGLYLERRLEVHKRPQPQAFFRMQVQTLDNRSKMAEEELEAFKNKHELTSLEQEQNLFLHQKGELHTTLNQLVSEEAEIESRILQLRQQLATTDKSIPMDDQMVNNLQARLVELDLEETQLLGKYSDQSRLVLRVRDEIEMVHEKLAQRMSEIIQKEILRNETDLQALKAKKESQVAQFAHYQEKQEGLNQIEMEFNRLRQEVDVHRENYRLYLRKFEESRISEAMDKEKIANVSLIEPAQPPLRPVKSNVRRNMVLAILLGGAGGFGLAWFSESVNDSLEKDEDVENYLHLPVLASIPQLER